MKSGLFCPSIVALGVFFCYKILMQKDVQNKLSWVEVSKANLAHNIKEFRGLAGDDCLLCPCVKANAYGHGLVEAAKIFLEAGADWLAVNALYEAEELREAGIEAPIYIMGYTLLGDLERAVELDCRLVVYDRETIEKLGEVVSGGANAKPVNLHIKVETGNNRQGVPIEELPDFVKLIQKHDGLKIEGLATHFANIEDPTDHSYAFAQIEKFKKAREIVEEMGVEVPMMHCANSAATILFPEVRMDMVRVGIASYGMWPSNETFVSYKQLDKNGFELKPALTWKTVVAQVKTVPGGEAIGYGCTCHTNRETKVAILPVGYYDGYDRGLSNTGYVLIQGKRAPILGRVCMNITMVDVTDIPDVALEDEVVLMGGDGQGGEISAEQYATWIGTINYEVTTRINDKIPRVII